MGKIKLKNSSGMLAMKDILIFGYYWFHIFLLLCFSFLLYNIDELYLKNILRLKSVDIVHLKKAGDCVDEFIPSAFRLLIPYTVFHYASFCCLTSSLNST